MYVMTWHVRVWWWWAQVCVTIMVLLWSARLGAFLFRRVLKTGKDSRFDEIKSNPRECPGAG